MALIMVIFMVALASTILIALTDSTYVAMRLNSATEKRVKAEYILKSAVNVAQVLIKNDTTAYDSPTEDAWMQFRDGQEIPGELIGLKESNVRISMQISSEAAKVPIRNVISVQGQPDIKWVEIVATLFSVLGFDNPDPNNRSDSNNGRPGGSQQQPVDSKQMVVNLIDYLDRDKESASIANYPSGIEGQLPPDQEFRNDLTIDSLASELGAIPGFTPYRVQRLLMFISNTALRTININAASAEVIQSLSPDIDATIAQQILAFREPAGGGPFTDLNFRTQLSQLLGPDLSGRISPMVTPEGSYFDVIAKVEYGTSTFMATAELVKRGTGRLPLIKSFQLY
jgi:type II secretory pathway component PulK